MKSTKKFNAVQRDLQLLLDKYPLVREIVDAIDTVGGCALLVGGAVRDLFLGVGTKDLDIEVHGLAADVVEKTLRAFGPVSLVGKQFGVFRLHKLDIDWSLPRVDSSGRKPEVSIDPFMNSKEAFARRDLTMNAMGIDLKILKLEDPFNGLQDLQQGILRAPNIDFFVQDPLRFFRVMQFISRFEMVPDEALSAVCRGMDISAVSRERIEMEFEKLLLKSKRPSLGIRWLHEIGRLVDVLPELAATVGVEQPPEYHQEGDVFEHSMQTVDAAVQFKYEQASTKLMVMYAALCHDLGKITATQIKNGRITNHGHAQEGGPLAKAMLKRITHNKDLIDGVCKLVRYHMEPVQFVRGGAKPPAYKRLANKLAPHATLQLLADLSLADKQGRNPHGPTPLTDAVPDVEKFLKQAQQLKVRDQPEEPILQGRDLMDVVKPGPQMGRLLARAYEIQIEQGITDKDELKKWVLN